MADGVGPPVGDSGRRSLSVSRTGREKGELRAGCSPVGPAGWLLGQAGVRAEGGR